MILLDHDQLGITIARHRADGKRIGLASGCFDLLHTSHVEYLEKAKSLCDILVVAVNSDSSVATIKGNTRPIIDCISRMSMLNALSCVDYVVEFPQQRVTDLLASGLFDIWCKGGEYTRETLNQEEVAAAKLKGITIALIVCYDNKYSTTSIIGKLRRCGCTVGSDADGAKSEADGNKRCDMCEHSSVPVTIDPCVSCLYREGKPKWDPVDEYIAEVLEKSCETCKHTDESSQTPLCVACIEALNGPKCELINWTPTDEQG